MRTEQSPLHQVHQQVLDALAEHGPHAKGACLDYKNNQIDYSGDLAAALPHVLALAEQRDWVRPPEDGDVRIRNNGLRLTLRSGFPR